MARILIVEDEPTLCVALEDILVEEGHKVLLATRGDEGLVIALKEHPALILLDVMLPGADGFSVCKALRQKGLDAPVLMLTAKSQVEDRVRGLDSGADDYLVKPFSTRELLARVRALLRRGESSKRRETFTLQLGDLTIDFVRCEARRGKTPVEFSAREFGMLRFLAERIGEPVSRDEFLDRVWDYHTFPTTRTVDNHIAQLRVKVETTPSKPQWIHTVHGVGYRLDEAALVGENE